MANYPGAQFAPRAKENKSGISYDANKKTVLFVEDFTAAENEIKAIEDAIGYNPAGGFADLVARIVDLEARVYALEHP